MVGRTEKKNWQTYFCASGRSFFYKSKTLIEVMGEGGGRANLANCLRKRGWSVLGLHKERAMSGDSLLRVPSCF